MIKGLSRYNGYITSQSPWVPPPPTGNLLCAKELLVMLGAIVLHNSQPKNVSHSKEEEASFSLTPLGKVMVKLPCHPRIAKMISGAKTQQEKSLACDVAALLEEKDPLSDQEDKDITLRISIGMHRSHRKPLVTN